MGLSGDFQELKRLARSLEAMRRPAYKSAVLRDVARKTLDLIDDGFTQSKDPYGEPWQPLKFRKGKPLIDTGKLANSFRSDKFTANSFDIMSNVKYAMFHQEGASIKGPGSFMVSFSGAPDASIVSKSGSARRKTNRYSRALERKKQLRAIKGDQYWIHYYQAYVPPRPMLPYADLPERWLEAYGRRLEKILEARFGA